MEELKSDDYSANEKKAAKEVNFSTSDVDAHTETVNMFVFYKEVETNQFQIFQKIKFL